MSVPKKRQTSSRGKRRAINLKLSSKNIASCKKCGQPVLTHRACKSCGTYNDKKIISTKLDKQIRSKTASK